VTITGINDLLVETGETVIVGIVSTTGSDSTISPTEYLTTTTLIDDDLAQIVLTANTGAMNESGGVITLRTYISGGIISQSGIDVSIIYSGMAINGIDYTTGASLVTIPAGQTGTNFTLNAINDILVE